MRRQEESRQPGETTIRPKYTTTTASEL